MPGDATLKIRVEKMVCEHQHTPRTTHTHREVLPAPGDATLKNHSPVGKDVSLRQPQGNSIKAVLESVNPSGYAVAVKRLENQELIALGVPATFRQQTVQHSVQQTVVKNGSWQHSATKMKPFEIVHL